MFQFESVSLDNFLKGIKNLSAKNGNFKNIPTHCLKKFAAICSPISTQIWISDTIEIFSYKPEISKFNYCFLKRYSIKGA